MANRQRMTVDGNEAAASVAFRTSETIAIYPITPSSPMAEVCDEWLSRGKRNLWGAIPELAEMQSEAGAAGAVHGALQAGALATTFTASQGLLLMIPNMYKIAGELTPFVMHVTARTIATHALSIFGDHSDVMACRQAGFALLCSNSVQEAHDMAAVAHAATLETRIPFMHFFDGFRTSHEVAKIEQLSDDDLRSLIAESSIYAHRQRGLTPDRPVLRGTAQNPDVFFQAREAANRFYDECPAIVDRTMKALGDLTGRRYGLFEYVGAPDAERVIVLMGSGAETAHEATDYLTARGEKVGVLKVRLYRPFSRSAFLSTLPTSVRNLAVLDRTKEPGAPGDPLYLDVTTALAEAQAEGISPFKVPPRVFAGRYGLSSKEFTPAMVKAVFDEIAKDKPKRHFTVGIVDDVTHTSLTWDPSFRTESEDVSASVFYGLGADGTVGANKNSIKILGQETDLFAQGYFVYDSKKSGAITISHLRTSKRPIRSAYLVGQAGFVACHQFEFVDKIDVLEHAAPGSTFLLNAPFPADEVWNHLPRELQEQIIDKKIRFFAIDAYELAKRAGMGTRINTIMQTCFFAIAGLLPRDEAIGHIKKAIEKTYGKRGPEVVKRNWEVVDQALAHLHEIRVPTAVSATYARPPLVSERAPDFVQKVTAVILAGKGDLLPVSAFPVDGTWPMATAKWEKRNIALEIPVWDSKVCIQCNQCALVCPHAAIRAKVYDETDLAGAPPTFKSTLYRGNEYKGKHFTIQVAPEDCTGCNLCVNVCPAKDRTNPKHKAINMAPQAPLRNDERVNYDFFLNLPELDRTEIGRIDHKHSQFMEPLFDTPARARAAARRRTSSCSRSSSAIACSSRTRPAARRSTAATFRRRRTRRIATAADQPGRIHCSRTMPSSASGSAWRSMRTSRRPGCCCRASARRLATGSRRRSSTRIRRTRPVLSSSASASRRSGGSSPGSMRLKRAGSKRSPTISSRRASGSSAATGGHTTSATAASITCWRTGGTSTSSSWIPRCTRTREASSRRRRRSAPPPSSQPPASRSERRIWVCSPTCTGTSMWRRSRSGPRWPRRLRLFWRRSPTRDPR